jgi:hypothetical protein
MQMTPTPEQFRRLAEAMVDARIARTSGIHIPIRGRGYLVDVLVNDLAAAWPIVFPVDPNAVTVRIAVGVCADGRGIASFINEGDVIADEIQWVSKNGAARYVGLLTAPIPPVRIPEVPASVEGV